MQEEFQLSRRCSVDASHIEKLGHADRRLTARRTELRPLLGTKSMRRPLQPIQAERRRRLARRFGQQAFDPSMKFEDG